MLRARLMFELIEKKLDLRARACPNLVSIAADGDDLSKDGGIETNITRILDFGGKGGPLENRRQSPGNLTHGGPERQGTIGRLTPAKKDACQWGDHF